MKKIIGFTSLIIAFALVSASANAQDSIFGRYRGILKQTGSSSFNAPFELTFTKSLKLTIKYSVEGTRIIDVTNFQKDGTYTGYAKAGGTTLVVGDGRWKIVGKSIKLRGTIVSLGQNYPTKGFLKFKSNKIIGFNKAPQGSVRYTAVK